MEFLRKLRFVDSQITAEIPHPLLKEGLIRGRDITYVSTMH
jgi:hypothetical protein